MYLLGLDIGSSSIKASLLQVSDGAIIAQNFEPKNEMDILAHRHGWAEQNPELWWDYVKLIVPKLIENAQIDKSLIAAIGISYQMHGLVLVDKNKQVLRPSIIWCDSRASEIGKEAFNNLGSDYCLETLLNSPGNFTASKLKWVKDNEPEVYERIYKIMLPGDFIAMKLTNKITCTVSGLSEGVFWDFKANKISKTLLNHYGLKESLIPEIHDTFSSHGTITNDIANQLGLPQGIPVSFKSGDQPNNALSLNVLKPGEVAATAGTSGVIYGVVDDIKPDLSSRVNVFAHVNHNVGQPRYGVLACINGTGILNAWIRKNITQGLSYSEMNALAETVEVGSNGLQVFPFGNGAERILEDANNGCTWKHLNFNIHNKAHVLRAAQEGIVFSFQYGIDIMKSMGLKLDVIKAGNNNMFQSRIFKETLATLSGAQIEIYDTDGAIGAAIGSGLGAGVYKSSDEAFSRFKKLETIQPNKAIQSKIKEAYRNWEKELKKTY
ncbi:xylulokinase [Hwangdonia lutea]|uniref:FGGY family carbohydrate kinase n=1 Tax=Hwangdonia lutea TaxID=3075823 RepID=A0AA97HR93_9FLAO|nr:FGGY family carbohydrate kinase [Hwangdonia sp. SCSIO 19198]WOD43588.1 FGGY family carbohydrate kinase [Hwangdonia sp. SCSIO 19198]